MHISRTLVGASLKATVCESLFPPHCVSPRSGMLESGVDRIITQVVDPKMNHSFRPSIETAISDFLSGDRKEENGCSSVPPEQTDPQDSGCGPKTP